MKIINLIEKKEDEIIHHHLLQERADNIFTLLIDIFDTGHNFAIELTEDETVTTYGMATEDSDLYINQPCLLKKDRSSFKLNLKNSGVHFFQLDMSKKSEPTLRVQEEELDSDGQATGMDHFLNSKLPVIFEIGKTEMLIHDVLSLNLGSVIELHRLVGQALDVYVGEELVAKGEVVVMPDSTFAARVIKVLPITEQMNKKFAVETGAE